MDFGVEHCELKLRLKSDNLFSGTAAAAATAPPFSISIYQLEQFRLLDARMLAQSKPPTRLMNFGNYEITRSAPINWNESFSCAWGEVLTFEVACSETDVETTSTGDCTLEWLQRKDHEDPYNSKTAFSPYQHLKLIYHPQSSSWYSTLLTSPAKSLFRCSILLILKPQWSAQFLAVYYDASHDAYTGLDGIIDNP